MNDPRAIFEWLVDGAPGSREPADVIGRLSDMLVEAGIPLHRTAAFVGTLHPDLLGRRYVWKPGEPVAVRDIPHDFATSPEFQKSPVDAVARTGKPYRRRLTMDSSPPDFVVVEELATEGVTDYLAAPLFFLDGQVHVLTFATRDARGFTDDDVATMLRVLAPLARVIEIDALRRNAVTLLDTYVGRDAGERIMAGKIRRGDVESIRAVIWFSDLRGFTSLAGTSAPSALIGVLNDVFGCQVVAIEKRGGEVLKFIGDGLLAIFPLEGHTAGEPEANALAATEEALDALRRVNEARAARSEVPLRFGTALHIGEVAYGNIGGPGRLDFTCIGPAVNLAARLEGLTGTLDRPLVVSATFAQAARREMLSLGSFELKGVTAPQEVFAPPPGDSLAHW